MNPSLSQVMVGPGPEMLSSAFQLLGSQAPGAPDPTPLRVCASRSTCSAIVSAEAQLVEAPAVFHQESVVGGKG